MSRARQIEFPTRSAKLTDIARGGRTAKSTARKSGDLSSDGLDTVDRTIPLTHCAPDPKTHAGVLEDGVVVIASNQIDIPQLEQPPSAPARSDVFDFKSLGSGSIDNVWRNTDEFELISPPSRASMLFCPTEGTDDSNSEPCGVEVIPPSPSRGSRAGMFETSSDVTEWYTAEQSHSVRTFPAMDAELHPTRSSVTSDLVVINDPSAHSDGTQAPGSAALPQIITMVTGALLIVAGVALAAAPTWHAIMLASDTSQDIRLEDLHAMLSIGGGWFGLAFILIGAALEVIGLRTRRVTYRA